MDLEILPDQTTHEFIQALKSWTIRKGRPRVMLSDNAKTSDSTSKCTEKISKDKKMQEFLVTE